MAPANRSSSNPEEQSQQQEPCPECKRPFTRHFKLQKTCGRKPCVRKRKSRLQKAHWEANRVDILAAIHDPGALKRRSEATKATWKSPKTRKKRVRGMRKAKKDPEKQARWAASMAITMARPEVRKRKSEAAKRFSASPEERQRRRERMQRVWKDPKYRKRTTKAIIQSQTPEGRKQKSEASKRSWARRNALLHAAEQLLAAKAAKQSKPPRVGRHREPEDTRQFFIIGKKVEAQIDAGKSLIDARALVAKNTTLSYSSVATYHKAYLKRRNNAP